jgi:hypothetical protein
LPDVAIQYSNQASSQLGSEFKSKDGLILEGDLEALKLVDLDQHGLGYLRSKLGSSSSLSGLSGAGYTLVDQYSNSNANPHSYIPRYEDKSDKHGYNF